MKHPVPKLGITHGGCFHADDVFSFAFLQLINPDIELKRVPSAKDTEGFTDKEDVVVFDIGGGEFDHHTEESKENRVHLKTGETLTPTMPFASFGKVVRGYYDHLMDETEYLKFDSGLVQLIDYQDAEGHLPDSQYSNPLSGAISSFNPLWDENPTEEDFTAAFKEAAEFAKKIIERYIKRYASQKKSQNLVEIAIVNNPREYGTVLNLNRYCQYGRSLSPTDYEWVVYPSLRGGYQLYSISGKDHRNKALISKEMINYLTNHCSVCTFCHINGFTATFESRDAAIQTGIYASSLHALYKKFIRSGYTTLSFDMYLQKKKQILMEFMNTMENCLLSDNELIAEKVAM